MTTLYKFTTQDYKTRKGEYNETLWGENIEHNASGIGELCSNGWIHAYLSPELAVILNPTHANIEKPILWESEGDIGKSDNQLKVGCTRLKTIRIIKTPKITTNQRVAFSILCAKSVCKDIAWNKWADAWLNNINRDTCADYAAASAAAYAAAHADYAATAYSAAYAAAYAAHAAHAAAAAATATATAANINLAALAKQALTY